MSMLEGLLAEALDSAAERLCPPEMSGRVIQAVGTLVRATGITARIGDLCQLSNPGDDWSLTAEVVGVMRDSVLMMPFGELSGLSAHTHVSRVGGIPTVGVGSALLGCILDGFGNSLRGESNLTPSAHYRIQAAAPDPLTRRDVDEVFQTGVRAIDTVLTCGKGQRVGIFAPAGVGKSTLLSMVAHGTDSDVNVVALVGERGREVGEFVRALERSGKMHKTVCVVATSDCSAAERAKAPCVAMAIAEYFRDQGKSVLLLMDSVTRYARALREIGLAAGEPPTRRGYPPSVLTALPKLFERAGQNDCGSITSFFTVLVEDDMTGDPIGEEVRATLDGHIVLSPKLADADYFPAIDILASRSRVMRQVVTSDQFRYAGMLRELVSKFNSVELLVQMGEYREGSDPLADRAIRQQPEIRQFLRQAAEEITGVSESFARLRSIMES